MKVFASPSHIETISLRRQAWEKRESPDVEMTHALSSIQRKILSIAVIFAVFIFVWPSVHSWRNPFLDFYHLYAGYLDPKLDWYLGILATGRMLIPRLFIATLLSAYLWITGKLPILLGLMVALIPPALLSITETHDVSRTFLILTMPIVFVATLLAYGLCRLAWWLIFR